jgi:hypothetical protein
VSHEFWRDVLGSPASLAGKRVKFGWDLEVIGVLPAGFGFSDRTQLWGPGS